MRGLGQTPEAFPITDYSVAFIATAECPYWTDAFSGLGPSMLTLLYHSFLGTPPANTGVSQYQMDRFTLRALQCSFVYDRFATAAGRQAILDFLELLGGLPNCKTADIQGLLDYQSAHGHTGPHAATNAMVWLLTRDPSIWTSILQLPACSQQAAPQPQPSTDPSTTPTTIETQQPSSEPSTTPTSVTQQPSSDPSTTPQPVLQQDEPYQPPPMTTSSMTPAPTTTATAPPEEKSNMMLYGLIGLAVVGGGAAIYFATRKKR